LPILVDDRIRTNVAGN
jgi:hypothetical protein